MALSYSSCQNIYRKLTTKAARLLSHKNYLQSLHYIKCAARWAYELNFLYADRDLERILIDITDESITKVNITSPSPDRFVLLETHGMDNRGLTQQYIRAFISMGVEFLYISIDCKRNKCTDILNELQEYKKATVVLYDSSIDEIEKTKQIISKIEGYKPSKLFLHIMPWDTTSLMVAHSLQGVTKYNINLTDHAFWLGVSILDYNIEFRSYGQTVSIEKRGLKKSQLLCLPYYPVLSKDSVDFLGFPKEVEGKTILFTGGAYYKMFGQDGKFFTIIDQLLDQNNDSVVLVAGDGDRNTMDKLLSKLRNRNRVYLIGNRCDINEVFKACDIYIDTYPISGGLMAQYASLNSKPILAYSDFTTFSSDQHNMLKVMGNAVCGYNNIDDFLSYSKKLLYDLKYRSSEGIKNMNLVPSVEDFNDTFRKIVKTHENKYTWDRLSIDYDTMSSVYLNVENNTGSASIGLLKNLKYRVFVDCYEHLFHFIKFFSIKVLSKFK